MSCTAHEANHSVHLPSKISLHVLSRLSICLSPLSLRPPHLSPSTVAQARKHPAACLHAAASDCLRSYAPAHAPPHCILALCRLQPHLQTATCCDARRALKLEPGGRESRRINAAPWLRHRSELVPSVRNNRSISVWLMQIHGICRVFREYPNPKYRVPDLSGITFSELISGLSFENPNF